MSCKIIEASKEYQEIVCSIRKKLSSTKRYIVAIDGADHAGKTSFARYMAWQLGMSLFERDVYMSPDKCPNKKDVDVLGKYIAARHKAGVSVIIEGICVLEVLDKLNIKEDFLVFAINLKYTKGTGYFQARLYEYNKKYPSLQKSHYQLLWLQD